ncbi:hypothetical protein MSMTP_1050 [Methanosarcina sp. MTP4]|uniref:hypothetical protein n=1 Tax=Methanosarcina sp. MTP4 TaxID=1434100 RepID=UPI0006160C04|nr:hypothetical protein [Methanosarcina sp. MTP4]AKB24519.1 hypothetical protein MSMTP_1050 [Methanosarcina sp. MTP4]
MLNEDEQHGNIIIFDVEFYDKIHEMMIRNNLPGSVTIKKLEYLLETGLEVSKEEFWTYGIFTEWKNKPGWKTFDDFKRRLPDRIGIYENYFGYCDGVVISKYKGINESLPFATESCGVAGSLVLMNRLFGFHEADWEKINVSKSKDLDFRIASTGEYFIEVEAKGTIVGDDGKSASIYGQKKDIEDKKRIQRESNDIIQRSSLFGVITCIPFKSDDDHECNLRAKCLLLDPAPEEIIEDPLKFKLLSRLKFYQKNLGMISDSKIITVLNNRIRVIEHSTNFWDFHQLHLINKTGKKLQINSNSFDRKTVVDRDSIVGQVFPISQTLFFFYGFESELFNVMIDQDFNEILNYKKEIAKFYRYVKAKVDIEDLKRYGINYEKFRKIKNSNKVEVLTKGNLFRSNSGRVVGFLEHSNESLENFY